MRFAGYFDTPDTDVCLYVAAFPAFSAGCALRGPFPAAVDRPALSNAGLSVGTYAGFSPHHRFLTTDYITTAAVCQEDDRKRVQALPAAHKKIIARSDDFRNRQMCTVICRIKQSAGKERVSSAEGR